MNRVDLDRLEAFYSQIDTDRGRRVVAAVVELRAAREVVEAARRYEGGTAEYQRTVWAAIGAYDEAVTS